MQSVFPQSAELLGEHLLLIRWEDGVEHVYPLDRLRAKCPCAECVDEMTGAVRVNPEMFPGMSLRAINEVGNYALRITFSDGHALGLFTFKSLRILGTERALYGGT